MRANNFGLFRDTGSMTLSMGNIDVIAARFLKIYFVDTSGLVQHDLEA